MDAFWLSDCVLVLPERLVEGCIQVGQGRILALESGCPPDGATRVVSMEGRFVAPGFVDLHVHGGGGADFMDGSREAFEQVCRSHLNHGTTTLLPTTTAGPTEEILRMLRTAQAMIDPQTGFGHPRLGARIAGVHLYGPHFHEPAKGCHPAPMLLSPVELSELWALSGVIRAATIAPEHPQAQEFAQACRLRGIRLHMGHSHCTFDQAREAMKWGVRHVDHLFCAMSDRARLRTSQAWPMRGGLLEATLALDELTTEVIADGCHLAPELLQLALKVKGPDRLALVTDAMRAMDLAPGKYRFGSQESGSPVLSNGRVGLMPDGQALASAVQGLDEGVRTMARATGASLPEVIRMASLTPARIAGLDREVGSLEVGKRADLVILDKDLRVKTVFLEGNLHSLGEGALNENDTLSG